MRRPPDLPPYIPSIHREGYVFIGLAGFLAFLLFFLHPVVGSLGLLLTVGVALFFRDPERIIPEQPDIAVSPADGRICAVDEAKPPPELNLGDTPCLRIGVFMSLLDAHINRMPVASKITQKTYRPGMFFNAATEEAGEKNERVGIVAQTKSGESFALVQIAGLVARRIVSWCEEGEELAIGERVGLIRFGSRADVYFPQGWEAQVKTGQSMTAGESIIAKKAAVKNPQNKPTANPNPAKIDAQPATKKAEQAKPQG